MNPPLLKVASISGKSTIRLRFKSPAKIQQGERHIADVESGEVEVELTGATPAPKQTWLWVGNSGEADLEGWLAQAIGTGDFLVNFWPVGLALCRGEWKTRGYRILVQSEKAHITEQDLNRRIRRIRPGIMPVPIELPAAHGQGTATLHLKSAAHRAPLDLPLPILIVAESPIELLDAPIGEDFHWGHTETLELPSPVWMAAGTDGKLCAGTELHVEDYLTSVNSSEMPADSPLEFLKAQVVAARSWLLANWGSHHPGEAYTVCAGDHCQCYYGQTRVREESRQAVQATAGEVLTYEDHICDARYAKACGGFSEPAANVWRLMDEPYLELVRDLPDATSRSVEGRELDLSQEIQFREFQQRSESADACCSPGFAPLNGELVKLAQLYRWQEKLNLHELQDIISAKTGLDLGDIQDLVPGRRGPSGRLVELVIVGSKDRLTVTPELEIRRLLSRSHLPSSAFWIERVAQNQVNLHGLGWGHGVGLCQIGAAALAAKGYAYDRILTHYYPKTTLQKIY